MVIERLQNICGILRMQAGFPDIKMGIRFFRLKTQHRSPSAVKNNQLARGNIQLPQAQARAGIFRHIDSGKGKRLFCHCHAHCKATCSRHDETGIKSTRSELTTLSRIRTSIRQTLSDSALNDYLAQRE
ncbi:hypothetical protein COLO4_02143 [Corchorus olitorius]|uniref:Uncharacterized protein n=1 Tax=Corchorus olitorius TaxID=93759 RepID=A0A1R3L1K5_9ROSI|nr:hypothetical protein COLO4_02143 [Corchorus olitorius]